MLIAEAVLLLLLTGAPQQAESTIPPDPQPDAQAEEAAALPAAQAEEQVSQPGEPAEEENPQRFYWDNGLWLEAPRLRLRMRIGGELHLDTAAFVAPEELAPLESDTGWRRARLDLRGFIGRRVRYRLRWDAASRAPHLKSAYVDIEFLRSNTYVRSGRFSAVFGLENAASSNDYVLMESSLTQVFVPPQETGFLVHSQGPEGNWDVGFSGASNEVTSCVLCDIRGLTGRFSRGFELAEGRRVLHAGANWATRWTGEGDFTRYRARPESFLSPYLVDTGLIEAERIDVGLVEAAFQDGPFALLAEYGGAWTRSVEATDSRFDSFYVLAAYTLTGEQRPYSHSSGAFGRPRPARRFLADQGGIGAIEVAARYSYLDLNDRQITGGVLRDVTLGANWYPSSNQRVAFNLIRAHRSGIGPLWVFQLRLQWSI